MSSPTAFYPSMSTLWGRLLHANLASPAIGAALLVAILFVNESNVRVGSAQEYSLDWQIFARLFACGACGLYGLVNLPLTYKTLARFPGAWCVLYALWGSFTVLFAADKMYSAVACAALWILIPFIPAVLLQLGGRKIVTLIVMTLTVYMAVGWVLYFAAPSLGRTAYVLPDLEVIYRMGGLNHANSTGRLAALGIVLLAALARERAMRWAHV
ncbi:MAG TPA: hypothetical protein VHV08_15525, partial [Pirellulales bacterium]|nr:hypothetical protein [Pirellulales bacterium]